jgi:hypothetical protein
MGLPICPFNYEYVYVFFRYNYLNTRYWSWNYRSCRHQTYFSIKDGAKNYYGQEAVEAIVLGPLPV